MEENQTNPQNRSKFPDLFDKPGIFIQDNQISDITPLRHLTTLKKVVAHTNNIQEIESVTSLSNLVYLDVKQNPIEDLSILDALDTLLVMKV